VEWRRAVLAGTADLLDLAGEPARQQARGSLGGGAPPGSRRPGALQAVNAFVGWMTGRQLSFYAQAHD
jgi:hypothetical protein